MRRIEKNSWLTAIMAAGMLILTACSTDEADAGAQYMDNVPHENAVYDGEWTIDKQVIDTARLEVLPTGLRLRLPESYLTVLCFDKEALSSAWPFQYECMAQPMAQPVVIPFRDQGYTNNAKYATMTTTEKSFDGMTIYSPASFSITVNSASYRVALLSNEPANAVYRNDNGLWTIGIPIERFLVTNTATNEEQVRTPHNPFTLYYNAKERIR